jgi:hypothetical protein
MSQSGGPRTLAAAKRGGRKRPTRQPPPRFPAAAIITGVAGSAGLLGLGLLLLLLAPPRPAPAAEPGTLRSGDLSLQIQDAGWITHDPIGGATSAPDKGFQMPASMMPGMPDEGRHRLYLEVVLSNAGQSSGTFGPQEFALRSSDGRVWGLNDPPSFDRATLLPGQTRSLDLYFDIPDTVAQVQLAWAHDGDTQQLPIDSQPPPPHNHG